jgi:DNA-binding response OmpR family regulator
VNNCVIVLEPDALQRDLILMALRRVQLEPLVCQQAADVSALLLDRKPVLMILDLTQPDRNGLDLLAELRQAGLLVLTRVIVISALTFPDVVMRANRLGVAAFMAKPIDIDLLLERVEGILQARDQG